jgi:hypothetical protein
MYEHVSKSFRTESITKYTLTFGITRWEATQKVMAPKLTRLTHKIVIQLHVVAEGCIIRSSRSRRPVRKLLDIPLLLLLRRCIAAGPSVVVGTVLYMFCNHNWLWCYSLSAVQKSFLFRQWLNQIRRMRRHCAANVLSTICLQISFFVSVSRVVDSTLYQLRRSFIIVYN